jgi:single-strand DNA-binding protein
LIGRLVQDVDFKITPTNSLPLAILNIATNRVFKDRNNQIKTETEFHKVIAWGKLAETCRDYLSKGRLVFVEGRIHYRNWLTPEGIKKTSTEIIAENIKFGPKQEEHIDVVEEFKDFEETINSQETDIWNIQF